jgi:phage terminase large subunit-like protein
VGISRIYTAAGGRLEPITASAKTAEGARPTFIVEDETHWWTDENGGTALDKVCRRNVGKIPGGTGRMLETTNAHAVGQQSVAERSYEAYLAMKEGRARRMGLMYDAREAPADIDLADRAELMAALAAAYGDSTWVDLERLVDEIWDPSTSPQESRRFYLNQIAAATDSWLEAHQWASCARPDKIVREGDSITLGFDGSRKRTHSTTDATALVGCRVDDGHLFEVEIWEQPDNADAWEVPVGEVLARLEQTMERYNVVGFFADPAKWEGHVMGWEARWHRQLKVKASREHPIQFWMTGGRVSAVVRALDQIYNAIVDGEVTHDGSHTLTRHILNARRHQTPTGTVIRKEHPESARKIDGAIAATLAWAARLEAVKSGAGARPTVAVPFKVR